jgi:hypothetical protein
MVESDEVAPLLAAPLNPGGRGSGASTTSHLTGAKRDGSGSKAVEHRKALEVYVKPPVYSRAAGGPPKLLTSKPLYLITGLHIRCH